MNPFPVTYFKSLSWSSSSPCHQKETPLLSITSLSIRDTLLSLWMAIHHIWLGINWKCQFFSVDCSNDKRLDYMFNLKEIKIRSDESYMGQRINIVKLSLCFIFHLKDNIFFFSSIAWTFFSDRWTQIKIK